MCCFYTLYRFGLSRQCVGSHPHADPPKGVSTFAVGVLRLEIPLYHICYRMSSYTTSYHCLPLLDSSSSVFCSLVSLSCTAARLNTKSSASSMRHAMSIAMSFTVSLISFIVRSNTQSTLCICLVCPDAVALLLTCYH
jgi:hypothetical protein